MKKKLVSIVLALGVMLTLFPVSAFAAGSEETLEMEYENTTFGTIKLSSLLDDGRTQFNFGNGDVRNWHYSVVEAGSTCTITPSGAAKYTRIYLTTWVLNDGVYDAPFYKNMPWHALYADGQAEDLAIGDELANLPLATSNHPAHFVFGKNTNMKSPFSGEPCPLELKADGTMYQLDIDFYNEAEECVASFIAPFFIKESNSDNDKPSGFTDVKSTDYFAKAVDWAVENKITSGTSKTTFSPGATCNRAQILSFLWRASGSPEPKTANPFQDIKSTDYFYKAALWAFEKDMVSGSSFGASTPCTRASTMEYMWKAAESPAASYDGKFSDVSTGADYAQAVAWAVKNNVTAGTSKTTFGPDNTCTRGQIVTFLYRVYGK